MDQLKKWRYLLLLPLWGNVIVMMYLKSKFTTIPYIKHKHWARISFLMGLMSIVGTLVTVFAFLAINRMTDIVDFVLSYGGIIIMAIVANYFANIPCFIYVNYLIRKGKSENGNELMKND